VIPYSGPVGTEVKIIGQSCHNPGSTSAYLVFQSVPQSGTEGANDIGPVPVDARSGRFETARFTVSEQSRS
jgi:hypothetical protein